MNSTQQDRATISGTLATMRGWLERIPYSFIALLARLATAVVFWRSGSVKLDDWAGTLSLFEDEYKVPLIPAHLAAYVATAMELGGAVLMLLGLGTRAVALAYLGMITVIQTFVYPEAWPTHIQWAAFLLILLARGPGSWSLDALLMRSMRKA
ncbi:MAG: DoxX family protein [Steroidobacteraceae bacterium]